MIADKDNTTQLTLNFISSVVAAPRLSLAFRSGMSRSKDFWAAAAAGVPIGVVANELTLSLTLNGIPRFIKAGGACFVDSGAFAELSSGVPPDFNAVLQVYESIADGCEGVASQLYFVAPDKVGDQAVSLERLASHASRVRNLIEQGCNVIVPLQRGVLPVAELLARAIQILGTDRFVAGIPSNKEALSMAECANLNHHAFHVLGRVQMNQDQSDRLAALTEQNPAAIITADANWLRSRIGIVSELAENERRARAAMPASERASLHIRPTSRAIAITAALHGEKVWGIAA